MSNDKLIVRLLLLIATGILIIIKKQTMNRWIPDNPELSKQVLTEMGDELEKCKEAYKTIK